MPPVLSILVPCFNESPVIEETNKQLLLLLKQLQDDKKISAGSFILYIDDGSSDTTWNLIKGFDQKSVKGIKLSRNFGHQYALFSGLEFVVDKCDINICIDADLQHDISKISEFIELYNSGSDIVYGVKRSRKSDSFFKKFSAESFYRLLRLFRVNAVFNHADFRLLSKRALLSLLEYKETNLFLRGIIPSLGYNTSIVHYDILQRFAGKSKYSLRRMLSLAIEGITSFSTTPLRAVTVLGLLISSLSMISVVLSVISYFEHKVVAGWTSTIVTICFFGGIHLVCLGIIGEYIGKIYSETKSRPRYIVEEHFPQSNND